MAYVEVRKGGRLVTRRVVDDEKARKGCRIRMGSIGPVVVALGESKKEGKYEFAVLEGVPSDDAYNAIEGLKDISSSFPSMSQAVTADFPKAADDQAEGGKSPVPLIEDYKIVDRLGEGGMGTVWRAVQLSTKREVAIKFLGKHRFASKKSRARFEREVSLAAKLTHPNIARVYHSGLHRNVYYYAMELIEGVHLDKYVKQNGLSQRDILELMRTVCGAVSCAHEQGIIHRDLKPSNILVTKDGQPHIVDFGLAKALVEDEEDLTISIEGEVTGTLAYMAPEQAAGHVNKISERTDVYSLGAILYELLTGRLPHDLSGSRYDIIKRIVEEQVQSPKELDHTIDSDLESLLLAALAKEPEDRYPSAAILYQDIGNYLYGEALLSRSLSRTYRIRKRIGKYRKRIVVAAGFVGLLFLVVTALVSIQSERKKSRELEQRLAGLSQTQQLTNDGTPETEKSQMERSGRYTQVAHQNSSADPLGGIIPVPQNPSGRIIYVDANAKGENNGYSWADAFVCLQDALAWAVGGAEIRVADGIYRPDQGAEQTLGDRKATFKPTEGIIIKGGYAGFGESTPDKRDIQLYKTTLNGDLNGDDVEVDDLRKLASEPTRAENSYHVVISDFNNVLDGLTITGGNADGTAPRDSTADSGGGMISRSNSMLINCTFISNSASHKSPGGGSGGGMSISGGNPTLIGCTFSGNTASSEEPGGGWGGGMFAFFSNPTLINCTFHGNWAARVGGGMHNGGGHPNLSNCTFTENSADSGGGMSNEGGSSTLIRCHFIRNSAEKYGGGIQNVHNSDGTISNCLFKGNTTRCGGAVCNSSNSNPEFKNCVFINNSCGEYGGAMYNDFESCPTLLNCTFSRNMRGQGGGGGGITNLRKSSTIVANCILFGDRPDEIHLMDDSTIVITYSNIQHVKPGPWPGPGNLNTDPLFVNYMEGDLHLRPQSPCVNAGDTERIVKVDETDMDGESRIIGGRIDMGADEFCP